MATKRRRQTKDDKQKDDKQKDDKQKDDGRRLGGGQLYASTRMFPCGPWTVVAQTLLARGFVGNFTGGRAGFNAEVLSRVVGVVSGDGKWDFARDLMKYTHLARQPWTCNEIALKMRSGFRGLAFVAQS
jgi:hypothetical protein